MLTVDRFNYFTYLLNVGDLTMLELRSYKYIQNLLSSYLHCGCPCICYLKFVFTL